MFQSRATDNYLNVFSKIVGALGIRPGEYTHLLDEKTQLWLHSTFGATPTQQLRDFLREPLGRVPFFASKVRASIHCVAFTVCRCKSISQVVMLLCEQRSIVAIARAHFMFARQRETALRE